jgi:hypothetical protein
MRFQDSECDRRINNYFWPLERSEDRAMLGPSNQYRTSQGEESHGRGFGDGDGGEEEGVALAALSSLLHCPMEAGDAE